jgi:Spy/CpxP family protein refolding chaperone
MPSLLLPILCCAAVWSGPGEQPAGAQSKAPAMPAKSGQDDDRSAAKRPDPSCPLSDAQKQAIQTIVRDNKKKAAPVALRLARTAHQVYENLLADAPDRQRADNLRDQMKDLVGQLVVIRGEAMREAVKILTSEQRRYLRAEIARPGAQGELIEIMMKVFQIPEK